MKSGEQMDYEPEKNWLNFGSDTKRIPDVVDVVKLASLRQLRFA